MGTRAARPGTLHVHNDGGPGRSGSSLRCGDGGRARPGQGRPHHRVPDPRLPRGAAPRGPRDRDAVVAPIPRSLDGTSTDALLRGAPHGSLDPRSHPAGRADRAGGDAAAATADPRRAACHRVRRPTDGRAGARAAGRDTVGTDAGRDAGDGRARPRPLPDPRRWLGQRPQRAAGPGPGDAAIGHEGGAGGRAGHAGSPAPRTPPGPGWRRRHHCRACRCSFADGGSAWVPLAPGEPAIADPSERDATWRVVLNTEPEAD